VTYCSLVILHINDKGTKRETFYLICQVLFSQTTYFIFIHRDDLIDIGPKHAKNDFYFNNKNI